MKMNFREEKWKGEVVLETVTKQLNNCALFLFLGGDLRIVVCNFGSTDLDRRPQWEAWKRSRVPIYLLDIDGLPRGVITLSSEYKLMLRHLIFIIFIHIYQYFYQNTIKESFLTILIVTISIPKFKITVSNTVKTLQ